MKGGIYHLWYGQCPACKATKTLAYRRKPPDESKVCPNGCGVLSRGIVPNAIVASCAGLQADGTSKNAPPKTTVCADNRLIGHLATGELVYERSSWAGDLVVLRECDFRAKYERYDEKKHGPVYS